MKREGAWSGWRMEMWGKEGETVQPLPAHGATLDLTPARKANTKAISTQNQTEPPRSKGTHQLCFLCGHFYKLIHCIRNTCALQKTGGKNENQKD